MTSRYANQAYATVVSFTMAQFAGERSTLYCLLATVRVLRSLLSRACLAVDRYRDTDVNEGGGSCLKMMGEPWSRANPPGI